MTPADPVRRQISDSPWFWGYLFATAGLVALILMGPKFGARQAEIERQSQGRHRALQSGQQQTPSTEMSQRGETVITLRPLYWLLGVLLAAAWGLLWWTHFQNSSRLPSAEQESSP